MGVPASDVGCVGPEIFQDIRRILPAQQGIRVPAHQQAILAQPRGFCRPASRSPNTPARDSGQCRRPRLPRVLRIAFMASPWLNKQ